AILLPIGNGDSRCAATARFHVAGRSRRHYKPLVPTRTEGGQTWVPRPTLTAPPAIPSDGTPPDGGFGSTRFPRLLATLETNPPEPVPTLQDSHHVFALSRPFRPTLDSRRPPVCVVAAGLRCRRAG